MKIDLVSWNVLADAYVRPGYFPRTPDRLLAPGARVAKILEKVVGTGADVLCLQEVEPGLVAAIEGLGAFDVRYLQKGRGKPDGCALVTRRATVVVEEVRELAYPDGSGHVALLARVRTGDCVLGVATTHVKWDPPETPYAERWATRQLGALIAAMEDGSNGGIAWVACGDFNVTPDDPVLALLGARRDVYADTPLARPTVNANGLPRRIDYVFVDPRLRAAPRAVREIDATTPMPSTDEPSDHLPIGARIELGP